jgi:hypothetical protein
MNMNLKELNHLGQKLSGFTKIISDANAVNELLNGNPNPAKRKAKNKITKKIINKFL